MDSEARTNLIITVVWFTIISVTLGALALMTIAKVFD